MLSSQCQHDQTQDNLNKKKMQCFTSTVLAPECVKKRKKKRNSTLATASKGKTWFKHCKE